MSARFFLDTNILLYCFDSHAGKKRSRAIDLVSEALDGHGVISFQVVQEFLNVATRKFKKPMSGSDARSYLQKVLKPLCAIHSSVLLYSSALSIGEDYRFSFYDSLIIASAGLGGCDTLYSEDLQSGQRVRGILIENPFEAL